MIHFDKYINNTIHMMNLAQVDFTDIPEQDRTITRNIELEITQAVRDCDTESFFNLLNEWRTILTQGAPYGMPIQRKAA